MIIGNANPDYSLGHKSLCQMQFFILEDYGSTG